MVEKTGLEILSELIGQVKEMNKKLDLLDTNVKTLINGSKNNNTSNINNKKICGITNVSEKDLIKNIEKKQLVMVSGKIAMVLEGEVRLIKGINIKIYDEKNKMVKETRTNYGGCWSAGLVPGKYVAEITGKFKEKELIPQNKNFIVPEGVRQFEVI